jgi:hypothetical protein
MSTSWEQCCLRQKFPQEIPQGVRNSVSIPRRAEAKSLSEARRSYGEFLDLKETITPTKVNSGDNCRSAKHPRPPYAAGSLARNSVGFKGSPLRFHLANSKRRDTFFTVVIPLQPRELL